MSASRNYAACKGESIGLPITSSRYIVVPFRPVTTPLAGHTLLSHTHDKF